MQSLQERREIGGIALPLLAKQQAAEQAPPMKEVEMGGEDTQSLDMELFPSLLNSTEAPS